MVLAEQGWRPVAAGACWSEWGDAVVKGVSCVADWKAGAGGAVVGMGFEACVADAGGGAKLEVVEAGPCPAGPALALEPTPGGPRLPLAGPAWLPPATDVGVPWSSSTGDESHSVCRGWGGCNCGRRGWSCCCCGGGDGVWWKVGCGGCALTGGGVGPGLCGRGAAIGTESICGCGCGE